MTILAVVNVVLALVLAPLLLGFINRTKAVFAGRTGQPLLQAYYDLAKLLQKGAVYSRTTTWIFRAGPVVVLASTLAALALLPFAGVPAPLHFAGDLLLLAYLLGLARFFTILAALDTGSSFEGMGASREAQFGALAEPALLLGLGALAARTGSLSLSDIFAPSGASTLPWVQAEPIMLLVAGALGIVFLAENCRIPVDDPNTHLELTMIHEVMVLDHSGPDFAFMQYASALKHWLLGALVVSAAVPFHPDHPLAGIALTLAAMFALALVVGVIESVMARLRMVHVPHLLVAATAASVLALVIVLK
jgi:formate hydrogenlyase subunit 4